MGKPLVICKILIFLLLVSPLISKVANADTAFESRSLTITAYLDGFVEVNHELQLDQTILSINVSLLGQTRQHLLIVDEKDLPLDFLLADNQVTINSIGSTRVCISYLTQDLTSKIGSYWILSFNCSESKLIVLPENASIIGLNTVPDLIENSGNHINLEMPPGLTEVTYTAGHALEDQGKNADNSISYLWVFVAIISTLVAVPLLFIGFWLIRNRRKPKPKAKDQENLAEVDLDKLFRRHRDLRQDEIQVINFLASKGGKAFEAELFELLNLPRTTTWRLIRRLSGMEIVDVKKSRRQNTVLIRDKYMKKLNE